MVTARFPIYGLLVLLLLASLVRPIPAQQKSQSNNGGAVAAASDFKDLATLLSGLPAAAVKPLDAESALLLSAVPLTCVDDLQAKPAARPYFWQPTYRTVEAYDKTRAFYGCNDWQTAVSSTWTLVTLLKRYPELPSGNLVREKLTDHLGRQNLEGELVGYLIDLERPNRTSGQANTALTLGLLLDYVDATRDMTIRRAVSETARRLYLTDTNCATETEATSAEMVSPCLAEAAVMSRILDKDAFVTWLDAFLPAAHSAKFKPLRSISFDVVAAGRGAGNRGQRDTGAPANPRATWMGLAFTRADAFSRISSALPAGDARIEVFRRLAAIHAEKGQQELAAPAAFDAPWVGALAVAYLTSAGGPQ